MLLMPTSALLSSTPATLISRLASSSFAPEAATAVLLLPRHSLQMFIRMPTRLLAQQARQDPSGEVQLLSSQLEVRPPLPKAPARTGLASCPMSTRHLNLPTLTMVAASPSVAVLHLLCSDLPALRRTLARSSSSIKRNSSSSTLIADWALPAEA